MICPEQPDQFIFVSRASTYPKYQNPANMQVCQCSSRARHVEIVDHHSLGLMAGVTCFVSVFSKTV